MRRLVDWSQCSRQLALDARRQAQALLAIRPQFRGRVSLRRYACARAALVTSQDLLSRAGSWFAACDLDQAMTYGPSDNRTAGASS
jgi:hypothetical protein